MVGVLKSNFKKKLNQNDQVGCRAKALALSWGYVHRLGLRYRHRQELELARRVVRGDEDPGAACFFFGRHYHN